jgi:hypothetical protein
VIKIQNIEFKTCHITEIDHEGEPLYLIQHDRSGIGAAFDHDEAVLQAVVNALQDGNLSCSRGNLRLQLPNKNIKLNKFLYQSYRKVTLNPADQIKYMKDTPYLQEGVFDFRSSNLGVPGRDKIPHTQSRNVDIATIGNRQYVKVWMKKYNKTFYCDNLPGIYDLLVDTHLCYLVSNLEKIQTSINNGEYIPHMGQVSLAAYAGKLTDNNLDQARAILNQLTNNQQLDVDHLIEDRCNCTLANLSLMDRANQAKYNFFGRFYDPWRIYGAYDRKTGQYLIELDLIKEFSSNTPVVVRSWFFRCKNIETLINLLENLQARNNTILSKSKLDELRIKYSGGLLAFPTPWERYQQVRTDYGQKMPKVKRDTVDDILHQQRLIDMDRGKFRSWTILQPKPSIEDLGNFFSAIYNSPVYLTRCEQIASAETQH